MLGPADSVPDAVLDALGKLGTVKRIAGDRPGGQRDRVRALSRTATSAGTSSTPATGSCSPTRAGPQDAAAAAPLSASGTYGPLLLLTDAGVLPQPLQDYLLDIQPGYDAETDRSAASTTTAGSSATRARSRPPCRRA